MPRLFGYGEDAFTLWALKQRVFDILEQFQDRTPPSDCLIFYRPSFGRSGGEKRAEFGEFDAIIASSECIYLIESKWDNLSPFKNDEIMIEEEQELRHRIFSWYIKHWDKKYSENWEGFVRENLDDFRKTFPKKRFAQGGLLAENLRFILTTLQRHCAAKPSEYDIKNVLLFFYNEDKSTTPTKINEGFDLIGIDYSKEARGNFIILN